MAGPLVPAQPAHGVGSQPVDEHELGELLADRLHLGDAACRASDATDDDLLEAVAVASDRRRRPWPADGGGTTSPVGAGRRRAPGTAARSRAWSTCRRRRTPRSPACRRDRSSAEPAEHVPDSPASSWRPRPDRRSRPADAQTPIKPNAIARRWSWWVASRRRAGSAPARCEPVVGSVAVAPSAAQLAAQITEAVALLGADETDAADASRRRRERGDGGERRHEIGHDRPCRCRCRRAADRARRSCACLRRGW